MINGNLFVHTLNGIYVIGLKNPNRVFVIHPEDIEPSKISAAVGSAMGFHGVNIWKELKGFSGYDALRYFHIVSPKDAVLQLLSTDDIIEDGDYRIEGDKLVEVPVLDMGEKAGNELYFRNYLKQKS